MDQVAAFYFTALPNSYAARTGRPDNVGVIGIALFSEAVPPYLESARQSLPRSAAEPFDPPSETTASADEAAPAAPSRAEREDAGARVGSLKKEGRLGTGHGQRIDSGAFYTTFDRSSSSPDAVIRIYYDSERNLVAQGIIPRPRYRYAQRTPDPFPGGFVPDP